MKKREFPTNTRIVILCGGRGVRLRKLTDTIPKPMIPLHSKPILELAMEHYHSLGFKHFIFCIGYKGDVIENAFRNWRDIDASFVRSGEDASMLQRIYDVRDRVGGDFIVVYGDTINKANLWELLRTHRENRKQLTMVVSELQVPFGLVRKRDRRIVAFNEKPVFEYYVGSFAMSPNAFRHMKPALLAKSDSGGLLGFFRKMIRMKEVSYFNFNGLKITFNTLLEHTTAEQQLLNYYTYIGGSKE